MTTPAQRIALESFLCESLDYEEALSQLRNDVCECVWARYTGTQKELAYTIELLAENIQRAINIGE